MLDWRTGKARQYVRSSRCNFQCHGILEAQECRVGITNAIQANIYMANQITRLYGAQGLYANSVNPGGIWTGLQVHWEPGKKEGYEAIPAVRNYMKSLGQGASTTVWGACAKELKGKGGLYLEDCDVASHTKDLDPQAQGVLGYVDHARNEDGEKRLWADSLKMVGLD